MKDSWIGPYRLLDVLGEGGMGIVYRAEQREPVERHVALKVLRDGLDPDLAQRFVAECSILALLDHPHVARVFESGSTRDGRAYFAMELVRGAAITRYCAAAGLALRARLELFLQACAAIEHAHQRGVLHGDLKPANLLVEDSDGAPRVKVIDFSIARALGQDEPDAGRSPAPSAPLGTPSHMSPEQAGIVDLDVDTRSDVFALGVVLYELLTGGQPFARVADLRPEQEPRRPSAVVSAREPSSPFLVQLQGDLDWIVLKALAWDRERRYASVAELAADVRRHLDGRPVVARPASFSYRADRFLRRNRTKVVAAVVLSVVLLAGAVGIIAEYLRANVAEEDATDLARTAAELGKDAELLRLDAEENAREEERQRGLATAAEEKAQEARSTAQRLYGEAKAKETELASAVEEYQRLVLLPKLEEVKGSAIRLYPSWPIKVPAMQNWLESEAEPLLNKLPGLSEILDGESELPSANEDPARFFRRTYLGNLVRGLERLKSEHISFIEEQLEIANTLEQKTLIAFDKDWKKAVTAIQKSDGIGASKLYRGLVLHPQLGLVPIGMDPRSGLWEFVHLAAGTSGKELPERDPRTGWLAVTKDTATVFVLIPGGTFAMGAQAQDPTGTNYDPAARPDEGPVLNVTLAPFFLAKHEMTRGQWERLHGEDAHELWPGLQVDRDRPETLDMPAQGVGAIFTEVLLSQHGLTLPTEAQWEYACRAGTKWPWSTGPDAQTLRGHANLADLHANSKIPVLHETWLNDHWLGAAPPGSFAPNAFGLHDMHGNMLEVCADPKEDYRIDPAPRDGRRTGHPRAAQVVRGGCYAYPAEFCRSSHRMAVGNSGGAWGGIRAARPVLE